MQQRLGETICARFSIRTLRDKQAKEKIRCVMKSDREREIERENRENKSLRHLSRCKTPKPTTTHKRRCHTCFPSGDFQNITIIMGRKDTTPECFPPRTLMQSFIRFVLYKIELSKTKSFTHQKNNFPNGEKLRLSF